MDRTRQVASKAPAAALDPARLTAAAWLHDVGATVPAECRAALITQAGLAALPEERAWPALLHQKVSVVLARNIFGVTDEAVLAAIGCHSTLRPGSTVLDQALFVADKLAWDDDEVRPYRAEVEAALERSVTAAAAAFLVWFHGRRAELPVAHPWLRQAYGELVGESW